MILEMSLGLIITDVSDMLTAWGRCSHTDYPKNIYRSSLYLMIDQVDCKPESDKQTTQQLYTWHG